MALEILKFDQDALTGHISALVRVVEVAPDSNQPSYGPAETVGIDHPSLTRKYGVGPDASQADVEAAFELWLAEHHTGALARKQAMDQRAGAIQAMAGRTLEFVGDLQPSQQRDKAERAQSPEPAEAAPA